MSRFYAGDVTGEEFKMVLLAAEHDPDLKEEIEIMTSICDKLPDTNGEGRQTRLKSDIYASRISSHVQTCRPK